MLNENDQDKTKLDSGKIYTMRDTVSQQSLLAMMNKFVQAVDHMDETVMIPSRLKDIQVEDLMDDRYQKNGLALVPKESKQDPDLYNFYQMINTVKNELVRGPKDELEVERIPEQEKEDRDRTAETFRYHLSGLFQMLQNLTSGANYLTTKYQQEVGDFDAAFGKRVSPAYY